MQSHELLSQISWLSGRWMTKNGSGSYPTIQDFSYHEILEFSCVGQPMFNYTSTSSHSVKGTPMHQERGFLRVQPNTNNLAFIVSHNFGLNTLEEGTFDEKNKEISLKSVGISRMSFAKPPKVTGVERRFRLLSNGDLEMVLWMETENNSMTQHLSTVYKKVDSSDVCPWALNK